MYQPNGLLITGLAAGPPYPAKQLLIKAFDLMVAIVSTALWDNFGLSYFWLQ